MTYDLDSSANIERFIKAFYAKVLKDSILAPIFLDVAQINLPEHLSFICGYWEKLLLGQQGYDRHTMNIHREVHQKQPFKEEDFDRWLTLFTTTCSDECAGPYAEKAKRIATSIAGNMATNITPPS